MPVLGHGLIGCAAARWIEPHFVVDHMYKGTPSAALQTVWMPLLIVVSYIPDLITELIRACGWPNSQLIGHSALIALVATLLVGAAARWTSLQVGRCMAIALALIVLHDVIDVLQTSNRVPLWPFWSRPIDVGEFIPTSFTGELILFGCLPLMVECRRLMGRHLMPASRPMQRPLAGISLVVMLGTATGVHWLRERRDSDLVEARKLASLGRYREALPYLDRAELWPRTARPGRIEHLRAEAYWRFGDLPRAEELYLRAYRADPYYFWINADLADFYASMPVPLDERRRLALPYVRRLATEFARHDRFWLINARISTKLGMP